MSVTYICFTTYSQFQAQNKFKHILYFRYRRRPTTVRIIFRTNRRRPTPIRNIFETGRRSPTTLSIFLRIYRS